MVDCTDCVSMEYDNDGECCMKGHELLLSLEIPDGCKDFDNMWW